MSIEAEKLNLKNIDCKQFSDAADLALDAIEAEFGLHTHSGRQNTKAALVNILAYFCLPNPERTKDIQ